MTTVDRPSFSQRLRERSWTLHQRAEGAGFMKALMNGEIERAGYALMVSQHLFIYDALETTECDLRDNEVAGPFITERLHRVPSLRADLDALLGTDWAERAEPLPATRTYAARIREMAAWPGGFVAHHYTRYLGDLSGGLAIGRVVARVYGLDGPGVSFYRFDRIDKPKVFKDEYRHRLDSTAWEPDEQERIIDEVLNAYRLNTEVFADLARELGMGAPR
ncbi:biliverdin-producing heme oxygenase [Phytoactinopolyspora halotolerans]|uniref:Biliverdin-producing heme oxygenase n=1 Tax=Phytoactinopolyspora halotolerans TaxID=1981512 RepID=A0A6L9S3W3_9ACTN|nr:biliverdin-producing heme oxygenase [Phytoactinopolyspora halotolerans]NED99117.1 biliverdin-producing heme oxygenase [Phytoactinopolyspora halotolerans]